MADTALYSIAVYDVDYILVSDNGGDSGVVYRPEARMVRDPREELAFGYYEDGYVHRHGREYGPGRVSYSPLDDSARRFDSAGGFIHPSAFKLLPC